mgnify:CR=1 FL=1
MSFQEIIGHNELKKHLLASIDNNKVSHAQLFCGPEGCGHFAMAVAYAKYLLCSDREENDSCGVCSSCRKMNLLSHPDVHFSFPIHLSKANKVEKSDDCIQVFREMYSRHPYIGMNYWNELLGDSNKAKDKLGWFPEISLEEMIEEMINFDLQEAKKEKLLKEKGFSSTSY